METTHTGAVLWRGQSELDGAPVVVIAAGLAGSRNSKTGPDMVQVYILRADVSPIAAVRAGADASICGACRHRGERDEFGDVRNRTCYVRLDHGPRVVFDLYRAGRYRHVDIETAAQVLAGRKIRLGAYGDPAAVPFAVWQGLLTHAQAWTGYTHQWARFPELAAYCMASVDTPGERAQARFLGFRTFRVMARADTLETREIACPAAAETGHKTTCDQCLACGGHGAKARVDIAIRAHGAGAGAFERAAQSAMAAE